MAASFARAARYGCRRQGGARRRARPVRRRRRWPVCNWRRICAARRANLGAVMGLFKVVAPVQLVTSRGSSVYEPGTIINSGDVLNFQCNVFALQDLDADA